MKKLLILLFTNFFSFSQIVIREEIPSWFTLPTTTNNPTFIGNTFPKGVIPPKNKVFWGNPVLPWDFVDVNGKNPVLESGFTHVDAQSQGIGSSVSKDKFAYLMGDGMYANLANPMDVTLWKDNYIKDFSYNSSLILLDFEHFHYGSLDIANKLKDFNAIVRARGSRLGLWAQGWSHVQAFGGSDGAINEASIRMWKSWYDTVDYGNYLISIPDMDISNSFNYYGSGVDPSQLYRVMQMHEISKKNKPSILSIPTCYVHIETLDGHIGQEADVITANNQVKKIRKKMLLPFSQMYADALWGMVWDGWYHFETGHQNTDDKNYYHSEGTDNNDTAFKGTVNGISVSKINRDTYFGSYNYLALAIWQMSQPHIKPIIENENKWLMPNFTTNGIVRTGDDIFPSFCSFHKDPLIRFKYSDDRKKVLYMAQNTYNNTIQNTTISDPNNTWNATITLKGAWPSFGIITLYN